MTGTPALDAELWQRAASFAARAHEGHRRKDGRTPYAAHPTRVALIVASLGYTEPTILAAALLHDTIEDTPVDYDEIAESFGTEVADIVACLSKDDRLPEPRREPAYDEGLARGPWQARLIKLADVYDNLCDCADDAPRERLVEKARRALALADGDERLNRAAAALQTLLECRGPAR